MAPIYLADIDRTGFILNYQIAIILPALGDLHRAGEIVGRSERKNPQRRQVILAGHPVHDLIQRAVSAGRDNDIIPAIHGIRRFARGIPFPCRSMAGGFNSGLIQPVENVGQ
ncbi:hypothetical protein D3C76_1524020 [compost metagenome]